MKAATPRAWRAPDGRAWQVVTRVPGASNAMVVFRHPDRTQSARDRYAWWVSDGPEARDVTARLDARAVLAALDDAALARLFARSMPIGGPAPSFEAA